jgi:hypothetical protein
LAASVSPLLGAQTSRGGKVAVAKPGESRFAFSTPQQGKLTSCKLTSEDSSGACTAFELSCLPQTGPNLHVHHREDDAHEARLILICQPGGFEKFFEEMGNAMANVNRTNVQSKMKEVMAKYGMELLGPPLFKPLREEH